jgi:tetratricopeptide (TPR) repeat protein
VAPAQVAATDGTARDATPAEATDPTGHHPPAPTHEQLRAERERALHEAREAAKEAPGDVRLLRAWAVAAYKAGALREARRAADAWILIESTPEPHILLAEILDAMGHRGEARQVLAEVLESHPESTQARRLAARYGAPSAAPETSSQKSQVARR